MVHLTHVMSKNAEKSFGKRVISRFIWGCTLEFILTPVNCVRKRLSSLEIFLIIWSDIANRSKIYLFIFKGHMNASFAIKSITENISWWNIHNNVPNTKDREIQSSIKICCIIVLSKRMLMICYMKISQLFGNRIKKIRK